MVASDVRTWFIDNAPLELRDAIAGAFASRGKRAGRLLKSCPDYQRKPESAGAWQSLMGYCAPVRVSVGACLMMPESGRATLDACDRWLNGTREARAILLYGAGAPGEFNVAHMRVKPAALATFAEHAGIDPVALGVY